MCIYIYCVCVCIRTLAQILLKDFFCFCILQRRVTPFPPHTIHRWYHTFHRNVEIHHNYLVCVNHRSQNNTTTICFYNFCGIFVSFVAVLLVHGACQTALEKTRNCSNLIFPLYHIHTYRAYLVSGNPITSNSVCTHPQSDSLNGHQMPTIRNHLQLGSCVRISGSNFKWISHIHILMNTYEWIDILSH